MQSLGTRLILSISNGKTRLSCCKTVPTYFSKQFYSTKKTSNKYKKPALPTPAEEKSLPAYFQQRLDIWNKLKEQSDDNILLQSNKPMTVTLLDGQEMEGETWITTPFEIAQKISNSLASEVIIAKVNNELWDLERPFECDSTVELLKYTEPEAQAAFWRSSSFILSEALERAFNGFVCETGNTKDGYYCDFAPEDKEITFKDFGLIEGKVVRVFFVKNSFERLQMNKTDLLDLFAYNKFKIEQINQLKDDSATVYRCGSFIDICDGPLVRYNKKVKAYRLRKVEVIKRNDGVKLQRISAISFPTDDLLKKWVKKHG